jgi:hypothetical protein
VGEESEGFREKFEGVMRFMLLAKPEGGFIFRTNQRMGYEKKKNKKTNKNTKKDTGSIFFVLGEERGVGQKWREKGAARTTFWGGEEREAEGLNELETRFSNYPKSRVSRNSLPRAETALGFVSLATLLLIICAIVSSCAPQQTQPAPAAYTHVLGDKR